MNDLYDLFIHIHTSLSLYIYICIHIYTHVYALYDQYLNMCICT